MECKHCGAAFHQQADLRLHLDHHVEIQNKVFEGRAYGAVYPKGPPRSTDTPTATGSLVGSLGLEEGTHSIDLRDGNAGVYPCRFCASTFPDSGLLREHEGSPNCEKTSTVCWVLIIDCYQETGYRIEERYLRPSDTLVPSRRLFRCNKCDLSYASQEDCDLHSGTHRNKHLKCEHCEKGFETNHALRVHYDWHHDRQVEHDIEEALLYHRNGSQGTTPRDPNPALKTRRDGEIVAVSFVSGSDLKCAFTNFQTGRFSETLVKGITPDLALQYDPNMTLPQQGATLRSHTRYLGQTDEVVFVKIVDLARGSSLYSWLFDNVDYQEWLKPTPHCRYLWLRGPSGCGKSTCTSRTAQRCLDISSQQENGGAVVSFSFPDQADDHGVVALFLRTAISELYKQRPELCARVPLSYTPLIEGVPLDHLWIVLGSLLACFPCSYCILDGPENLTVSDKSVPVKQILEFLTRHESNIKVLVTSNQPPSAHPPSLSNIQWTELELPVEAICTDIKAYATSELRTSETTSSDTSPNTPDVDHLVQNAMGNLHYITLAAMAYRKSPNSNIPPSLDGLLSQAVRSLSQEPPLLRESAMKLLQWMIVSSSPLTREELDELLTLYSKDGILAAVIIQRSLQGLVRGPDYEGLVRFTIPSVRRYLTTGTTSKDSSRLDPSHPSPVMSPKQANKGATVDLLRYMAAPGFDAKLNLQSMRDSAKPGLFKIAVTRWISLLTRTAPTTEIVSHLASFMNSCLPKLLGCLAQLNPGLALRQCYSVELERWLQKAQVLPGAKQITARLAQCRKLVFQTIGRIVPADRTKVIWVLNCLGQLHVDSQLFHTAEELFLQGPLLSRQWAASPQPLVSDTLPFYVFGHSIHDGRTITSQDVYGRSLAIDSATALTHLTNEAEWMSTPHGHRSRIIERLQRIRRFKHLGLHDEAATMIILQEIKRELEPLRWNCPTPADSVLGLACLLLEQGRTSEADALLRTSVPELQQPGHLVLLGFSMETHADHAALMTAADATIGGLDITSWEAILAIDRLGRHYVDAGDPRVGRLFNGKAYQLSQRSAGLHDQRTVRCLQGLVNAYLSSGDFNTVYNLLTDLGSLSASQLREVTPEHPCAKMNYAIMLHQLGLREFAATVVDEMVTWLRTQPVVGDMAAQTLKDRNQVAINVGGFLIQRGRLQEAEVFLKKVLADPGTLSPGQIQTAKTNLVACLKRQDRVADANTLQEEINAGQLYSAGLDARTAVLR